MPKSDDRPIDSGIVELKGKTEAELVEWWKERFALVAAIPVETARVGALTPQLRQLTRLGDAAERRRLTKARLIAFAQLPAEQRQIVAAARKLAWDVDRGLLEQDQKLVEELMPELAPSIQAAYPRQ